MMGSTRDSRSPTSADTRLEGGPEGRVYTVPFARVWDELVNMVEQRRRWRMKHQDEELGIITVSCRTLLFRFVDDLTIWVTLDEDGLTRVEALSQSRVGTRDLGANARRITRLMTCLDDAVGSGNRLHDPRTPDQRAAESVPRSGDGASCA
ncbi:MAG: DUF1499 domain-containing protein [Gemmatimonadota bacterium]